MSKKHPEWITNPSQEKMHDDFRAFLWYIWKCLNLPTPTAVQYDIAMYLQHGDKRRIIEAFRGVGKSWITAAYVLWLLYRDPQHRIMVVSANKERADAFSIFTKRLIEEIDILLFLRPNGGRDSNIAFDVGPALPDQAPSVKSVGITGQLTGGRANTIIADDIEVPKNSATETQRERLGELVKEFDAVIKPGGEIIYLGTPQSAQSLYNIIQTRGYNLRIWPARYTTGRDKEGTDIYGGSLADIITVPLEETPTLELKTTEPTRFSDLDLAEREASYGKSGFALQFMLDTSLSDAHRYPLKCKDLMVLDVRKEEAPVQITWASGSQQHLDTYENVGLNGDKFYSPMYVSKEWAKWQGCVMFIDPSGRGADETAYCVTRMLNGVIYVVRWGGLIDGHGENTLTSLATIAKEESVNTIMVEANFGDGMWLKLFSPTLNAIHPCTLDEYKVMGQKEVRIIDKLEPVFNQHRLVMTPQVIDSDLKTASENLSFSGIWQLTHITRDRGSLKHDDRLDVLAEAVGYWMEQVARDVKKAEQMHKSKLLDVALKAHQKACKVRHTGSGNKRYSGW